MEECKIKTACDELNIFLSNLSQPNIPSPEILYATPSASHIHPGEIQALGSSTAEAYRCKCSFQIIGDVNDNLTCVVRENGTICHLPEGIFPPANRRIREAMKSLINLLNKRSDVVDEDTRTNHTFNRLRENLTSVTFDTSWDEAECLVTLHYGPPGLSQPSCKKWKQEAQMVCDECQFVRVTGRSKGIKMFVSGPNSANLVAAADDAILEEGIIHDTLWLTLQKSSIDAKSIHRVKSVSLVKPEQCADTTNVQILYQKPATAFQHPNAGVMLTSLHWILNTLSKIAKQHTTTRMPDAESKKLRILEMYNGAGAHTIPLAKSKNLGEIVAVELDERLVNACRNNCRLNNCLKGVESDQDQTLVEVFKGDAAEWAAKTLRCILKKTRLSQDTTANETSNNGTNDYNEFDILLVDPPRQGLDTTVCEMAIKGTFSRIIYISCGRRALIRDLKLLCTEFDIEDLAVIDLFPGTDAVETLIHLKRKMY
jgi:tRNA/tmRNA/rRNA uracil-C5-methylase (TrmA/RlmC/RlmD family)